MKPLLIIMVTLSLSLAGCGEKSGQNSSGTNASGGGTTPGTAPADYVGALGKGQRNAIKTVDTASLNQAIQLFSVDKGRNAKNLDELVQEKYMPKIPAPPLGMKYDYDANSGTVRVVKQ